MVFATKITIDGTDVTSYCLNYTVVDVMTDFTSADISFYQQVINYVNFDTQSELVITRGTITSTDVTIFKGVVSEIVRVSGGIVEVKGLDKLWLLERKSMTGTYDINIDSQAGVISEIAKDIIETHGGLTADVVDSGSVFTIDKYYCLNNTLMDLLEELAELIDYFVYYNPQTDTVYFKPFGYETYPDALTVGTEIINIPEWTTNYGKMANIVTITGDYQELETTEETVASGGQTVFTVTKTPTSVKVYDNGTLKAGGVIGQSASYDYSVDKENKTITFTSGVTGGHTIQINYSYMEPIIVTQKNSVSRTKYGDYTYNKYIDTIKSTADAELKVQEIIDKFGEPSLETKLMVIRKMDIRAGMTVDVVDTVNDVVDSFVVRKIIYRYPEVVDQITIDDEPLFANYVKMNAFAKRIGRLERKNQSAGTLINQRITLDVDFKPRIRYHKVTRQSIAGDTLVWGHPIYGIWGSFKWGGDAQVSFILGHPLYGILGTSQLGSQLSSVITVKLVQGNMTYEEYAYDTEFHDAINSTATFSTVTQDISFTAGQIWYSSVIDLGTTLGYITVGLGTVVGTLKIEISSDNKVTWQEITADVRTAVASSDGIGTYIRITENAAGVATIVLTQDAYGRNTKPLIKAIMEEA